MNILDFANPISFWWALAALPIIALYILKVRMRRVPASTLLFWNQLYDEKKPRSWWQQLRHWLSLLLQLAFLGLVIAALVDPLWSWQKDQQRRVVLVLDNSASMQAVGADGRSRFEMAQAAAIANVRALRDGDELAVVLAGGRPEVLLGMTNHQRWLVDAITETQCSDAPSALEPSILLAKRLLSGWEGEGEAVVLTDGCSGDLETMVADEGLKVYGVGDKQDNLAITRYQVRRSLLDAIGYQVLVDVTNFSDEPKTCRLELDLEGDLVDVIPMTLEPNATITRIVNHTSAGGGTLNAKLDAEDALAVDNVAVAILPQRKPIPITLVSQGNLFVASVLRAIPLVELTIVEEYDSTQTAAIHVFDQVVPTQLPPGPILVVDPTNDCELWQVKEDIEQPLVAKVDADSPLTQHVRLENVLFPGAKALEYRRQTQTLISDPLDTPMLARIPRRNGDVVVLSCSLEKGDLPLRIAFPVLMKNTIEWFQGEAGVLRSAAAAGQMVSVPVKELAPSVSGAMDTSEVEAGRDPEAGDGVDIAVVESSNSAPSTKYELVSPDGNVLPVATGSGQATVGPLLRTGIWQLRPTAGERIGGDQGLTNDLANNRKVALGNEKVEGESDPPEGTLTLACNLTSSEESDLRPRLELQKTENSDMMLLGGRSLWFYLTMLAVGLIAVEWWLYNRRIVG